MKQLTCLILLLFVMVVFSSCQNKSEKRAERITEKIMERATGEDVDIDVDGENITIKTDEGTITANTGDKKWPSDIPGDIPKFDFGKFENVTLSDLNDTKIWAMIYKDVPGDVLTKYQNQLKKKGFETHLVSGENGAGMLSCEKGDLAVAVMASEGNASVSVVLEKN